MFTSWYNAYVSSSVPLNPWDILRKLPTERDETVVGPGLHNAPSVKGIHWRHSFRNTTRFRRSARVFVQPAVLASLFRAACVLL